MSNQIKGFKEVFSKPYYLFLMVLSAFVFYLLNVILADFQELKYIFVNFGSYDLVRLLFAYFIGFPVTITFLSALSMFVIALLFGSYISLATYKTKQIKILQIKRSFFGSMGIFLGFIAPGCAACGLGFASLIGISGVLIALPFQGLEISFLALFFLGYANWKIAGKINQNSCSIKIKRA